MSLKTALLSADDIEIKNGILTIYEVDNNMQLSVAYGCFICDIFLNHPHLGKGTIVDYKNNKWICDFISSTSLQEIKTKTLINYIN